MHRIEELLSLIRSDDEVIASGLASGLSVAVTTKGFVRAAHDGGIVVIPWEAISKYEWWNHAHRWGVRLFHSPIDPGLGPSEAPQWWRPWDKPKHRRLRARLSRETELTFSTDHTEAALALKRQLGDHRIVGSQVPSPVLRDPGARAELRGAE